MTDELPFRPVVRFPAKLTVKFDAEALTTADPGGWCRLRAADLLSAPGGELEKDLSALSAVPEENEPAAATAHDTLRELDQLQVRLNQLLRGGRYCAVGQEMERVALQVLSQAPDDQAAYHAMVLNGIIHHDLNLIYLMSKIGQRARFLADIYTYDLAQSVQAKLDVWQDEIFNPAIRRTGRDIALEFVDCAGKTQVRTLPPELLSIDIPQESLRMLVPPESSGTRAAPRMRVSFAEFMGIDTPTFLRRLYHLIEVSARADRVKGQGAPIAVSFKDLPPLKLGVLQLDLSDLDLFGYPGQVPFKLRRERGPWMSFVSDGDRHKRLLLWEGDYYLMVNKKVRSVYSIREDKTAPVAVQ